MPSGGSREISLVFVETPFKFKLFFGKSLCTTPTSMLYIVTNSSRALLLSEDCEDGMYINNYISASILHEYFSNHTPHE